MTEKTASRNRGGRKPLPPDERKDYSIRIRMTDAQRAAVEQVSEETGRPMSEVVRLSGVPGYKETAAVR